MNGKKFDYSLAKQLTHELNEISDAIGEAYDEQSTARENLQRRKELLLKEIDNLKARGNKFWWAALITFVIGAVMDIYLFPVAVLWLFVYLYYMWSHIWGPTAKSLEKLEDLSHQRHLVLIQGEVAPTDPTCLADYEELRELEAKQDALIKQLEEQDALAQAVVKGYAEQLLAAVPPEDQSAVTWVIEENNE